MFKKIFYENQETNYSISDEGQVRNDKTGRIMKGMTTILFNLL